MSFQCLKRHGNVLFAATTSHLDTFNLITGARISRWSCPAAGEKDETQTPSLKIQKSETSSVDIVLGSEPPAKKRRISQVDDEEGLEESITKERPIRHKRPKPTKKCVAPNVVALACTSDGAHVIAVTGEDKSVRVLEQKSEGVLKQLSVRAMLKRPCAIAITDDDSTIICADKFGDVYSIPVIYNVESSSETSASVPTTAVTEDLKPIHVSANLKTIHTKRNRDALEQQLKQKARPGAEKAELKFPHELLLGHVSMLTDIALRTIEKRNYILTADRDEHIRVSRGIPQAHIIENFCLGHKEFISRLLIPSAAPHLVVSGGGEDEIYLWNWTGNGTLLSKLNIKPYTSSEVDAKTVVSGICDLGSDGEDPIFAIYHEGFPTLMIVRLTHSNKLELASCLTLPGNILALASDTTTKDFTASIDIVHEPRSTTKLREKDAEDKRHSILKYTANGTGDSINWDHDEGVQFDTGAADEDLLWQNPSDLSTLFYTLGNLRKRAGEEEE